MRVDVPAFVVIGGGQDGIAYVRRLLRAVEAGGLRTDRIVVVDRDAGCAAAVLVDAWSGSRTGAGPSGRLRLELAVCEWNDWLDANMDGLEAGAHLVPYHWAPHLLLHWLEEQSRRAGVRTRRAAPLPARGLPFEATTSEGDRALSYASWPCPPACIEPALCPHTRGPRDWSLAKDLAQEGAGVDTSIVFRSLHLVWGVGTIPVDDIRAARDRLIGLPRDRPHTVLVATSSHCHALATPITVG